jgi:hypothetical protein
MDDDNNTSNRHRAGRGLLNVSRAVRLLLDVAARDILGRDVSDDDRDAMAEADALLRSSNPELHAGVAAALMRAFEVAGAFDGGMVVEPVVRRPRPS